MLNHLTAVEPHWYILADCTCYAAECAMDFLTFHPYQKNGSEWWQHSRWQRSKSLKGLGCRVGSLTARMFLKACKIYVFKVLGKIQLKSQ